MTTLAPSPIADLAACFARAFFQSEDFRLKLREAVNKELRQRRVGLDFVQAVLLFQIGERELTAGELQRFCYGKTNVTYNLKLLKARGYVAVNTRDDDERKRHIRRTDKGREVAAAIGALFDRHAQALGPVGDITMDDLVVTERTLRRLAGFLDHQNAYGVS